MKRSPRRLRLRLIEPPNPTRLLRLDPLPYTLGQNLPPILRLITACEESSLPLPSFTLLPSPVFTLSVLDLALLYIRGVHIAFSNGRDDFFPGFVCFPRVLLFESRDDERGDGCVARIVGVDDCTVLSTALADGE